MFGFLLHADGDVHRIVDAQTEGQSSDGHRLRVDVVSGESHDAVDPCDDHHQRDPRDHAARQATHEIALACGVDADEHDEDDPRDDARGKDRGTGHVSSGLRVHEAAACEGQFLGPFEPLFGRVQGHCCVFCKGHDFVPCCGFCLEGDDRLEAIGRKGGRGDLPTRRIREGPGGQSLPSTVSTSVHVVEQSVEIRVLRTLCVQG